MAVLDVLAIPVPYPERAGRAAPLKNIARVVKVPGFQLGVGGDENLFLPAEMILKR
ncbi:MAG: hypothetical protein WC873_04545 [Candidatus Gracilibacteria bacterium]